MAALAIAALVIAGCGSSAASNSTDTASGYAQGVRYSDCMRSLGVRDYPDPDTGAAAARPTSEINPQSPAVRSAEEACAHLHPGSNATPPLSAAQRAGMIAYARCIREHGVPNFPDPRFGPGGEGIEVGVVGATESASPAFRQALKSCEHAGTPLPALATG
ncbi:MAG: hypothetical protein ABSH51_24730 [Solirubrobacteraceae bacterium]